MLKRLSIVALLVIATVCFSLAFAQQKPEAKHGFLTMNPFTQKWEVVPMPEDAHLFVLDVNSDPVPAVAFATSGANDPDRQVLLVPVSEFEQYQRKWDEEHQQGQPVAPPEKKAEK